MPDHLRRGRACYERRTWRDAYEAFLCADSVRPLEAVDLERLATSAYLVGRDGEFLELLERLHRECVARDDLARAGRCAFWLALSLLLRGEPAHANAWIVRGQRLVERHDCVERGYLLLPVVEQHLRDGRLAAAHDGAASAAAIGERFHDSDLTAAARHAQGRALIEQGDVTRGLGRLDETMLSVVAGELSPIMTGLMYCSVIDACRQVYALGRAREWTLAFSRVCEQQPDMVTFTGTCLVHRAEILQFHGAWTAAMTEAEGACERAERAHRRHPAAARYQQAEIHRLRGEFAQAEEGYRATSRLGFEPQPGLALLRMMQGRRDAACAAIQRLVSATVDRMQRARLLPAHIEIMLAAGCLDEARRTCAELEALAEAFDSDVLRATTRQSEGAIALAAGQAQAAIGPLREACDAWVRLEAPYESARVRVLLARACRALGDEETAALELETARATFERLGAAPELARLDGDDPAGALNRKHPLTVREREVLRLIASGHTNKAIAAALGLSERTIDRHVSNILGKLDVPSRTAATAYGYDHHLF
jgi:DNA-binding CsgD family transcriptional regulator